MSLAQMLLFGHSRTIVRHGGGATENLNLEAVQQMADITHDWVSRILILLFRKNAITGTVWYEEKGGEEEDGADG